MDRKSLIEKIKSTKSAIDMLNLREDIILALTGTKKEVDK